MNKGTSVLIIVLIILIGGGLLYVATKNSDDSMMATSTSDGIDNDGSTTGNSNGNTNNPTQASAPTVITNQSGMISETAALLSGSVVPKGGATAYWYEYGSTANLGSKTSNQTVGSGYVSIEAPGYITNLTSNTTYYYKLVAENQFGRVSGTQYSFKTVAGAPQPVGGVPVVESLAAVNIAKDSADLKGNVTPNKNPTQYWFEYGKSAELGNTTAFSAAGDGNAKVDVSLSLANLDSSTAYYFRLNAQNKFGTINGKTLNFKTSGQAQGSAPKVSTQNTTGIASTSASFHGTVNPNSLETQYWFEYSTDAFLGSLLPKATEKQTLAANVNISSVKADVSNLQAKTTYYVRIVAQNSLGTTVGNKLSFKTK